MMTEEESIKLEYKFHNAFIAIYRSMRAIKANEKCMWKIAENVRNKYKDDEEVYGICRGPQVAIMVYAMMLGAWHRMGFTDEDLDKPAYELIDFERMTEVSRMVWDMENDEE